MKKQNIHGIKKKKRKKKEMYKCPKYVNIFLMFYSPDNSPITQGNRILDEIHRELMRSVLQLHELVFRIL